ncbi:uncharacterized protein LOC108950836 [Ciona intestinalis]
MLVHCNDCGFSVILVLTTLAVTNAQLVRPQRLCYDSRPKGIDSITLTNLRYFTNATIQSRDGATTIVLSVTFTWDVPNPEGISFDGFLVQGYQDYDVIMHPIDQCSSNDSVWLNTTHCPNRGSSLCPDGVSMTSQSCPCPVSNCSALTPTGCRGISSLIVGPARRYVTIPANSRKMKFIIDFMTPFDLTIRPYYSNVAGSNMEHMFVKNTDCMTSIMKDNDVTGADAIALCCAKNIKQRKAIALQVVKIVPDLELGKAEVEVTWLPPVTQEGFVTWRIVTLPVTNVTHETLNGSITAIPLNHSTPYDTECYNSSVTYRIVYNNMRMGVMYKLHLTPVYSGENEAFCSIHGNCLSTIDIDLGEAPAGCTLVWQTCSPNSTCQSFFPGAYECVCKDGYNDVTVIDLNGVSSIENVDWNASSHGTSDYTGGGNMRFMC